MMINNIKLKLENLISELESNEKITLTRSRIEEGIDDFHFEVLKSVGLKFAEDLIGFYELFNGCRIQWECNLEQHSSIKKYSESDETIEGEIRITSLSELLYPQLKITKQFENQFLKDEVGDLQHFRLFDVSDDYMRVGYIIENKIIEKKLFYILEEADGFSELPFSFEKYLELMIKNKGVCHWNYAETMRNEEFHKWRDHYFNQIFETSN